MTIDEALLLEDALDMDARGMTKEAFVECCVRVESVRKANAAAWDAAQSLIQSFGTRRKAMNHVQRELDKARDEFFPF